MKTYTFTQEKIDSSPAYVLPGVTGPGEYTYSEANNLYSPVDTPGSDFDRGFGIGGLGRHVEEPFIPSVAQMAKLERMEARATHCRRCGESDVVDGAMFTTGGGNVCDDCF